MVRRAKRTDIVRINSLLSTYSVQPVDVSYVNHRDIALVAEYEGKIIGFIWAGLMRGNRQAYIDCFTVDASYSKAGVGNKLAQEMLRKMSKLGVQDAFGIIMHGEFHDRSAVNSLKMGMYAKAAPFTYVYGSVPRSIQEVGQ